MLEIPRPWRRSPYERRDVAAIKALAKGEADAAQQQLALRFIVEKLAHTYDLSFRPDNPRETDFAEGKRYVGLEIVAITKMDMTNVRTEDARADQRVP